MEVTSTGRVRGYHEPMPTVLTVLLLSLAGCRDKEVVVEVIDTAVTDSATTDSVPEVDEPEMCTQDEFCDAMLECFSIMGEALCESYFQNGMGMCNGEKSE